MILQNLYLFGEFVVPVLGVHVAEPAIERCLVESQDIGESMVGNENPVERAVTADRRREVEGRREG